jgi:hypothetical protein
MTIPRNWRGKNIQVVRGLPHGLTEKAIEAAQRIKLTHMAAR